MWNYIRAWWEAEGAMVGLQGMSDRMLADIGLQREGLRDTVLGRTDHRQESTAVEDRKDSPPPRLATSACVKPC